MKFLSNIFITAIFALGTLPCFCAPSFYEDFPNNEQVYIQYARDFNNRVEPKICSPEIIDMWKQEEDKILRGTKSVITLSAPLHHLFTVLPDGSIVYSQRTELVNSLPKNNVFYEHIKKAAHEVGFQPFYEGMNAKRIQPSIYFRILAPTSEKEYRCSTLISYENYTVMPSKFLIKILGEENIIKLHYPVIWIHWKKNIKYRSAIGIF